MSRARAIVAIPSGRRTKRAVLVFWLIVVALLGSLAGKLTGAEKTDASACLPPSAEATTGPDVQARFRPPNISAAGQASDRQAGAPAPDPAETAADTLS